MTSSTTRKTRPRSKPKANQTSVEVLILPKALEMRNARALQSSLLALLEGKRVCKIDAGQVTKLSTGCAQVLVSFLDATRSKKLDASVVNPSQAFSNNIELLGLGSTMNTYLREA